ncbi:MAG: hypothetical protein KatS3mg003_0650 [Candidatus Nitrosocaldaceae archaeon]|nr:MAG: hypothetical protein KatS3mg003_0650 [Candidatus Nitrosocaldaceae archaeon]
MQTKKITKREVINNIRAVKKIVDILPLPKDLEKWHYYTNKILEHLSKD